MYEIKCPRCKHYELINQSQVDSMKWSEDMSFKCPNCDRNLDWGVNVRRERQ